MLQTSRGILPNKCGAVEKRQLYTSQRSRPSTIASPTNQQKQAQMSTDPQKNVTSWASKDGSFKRQTSAFRDAVTPASQGGKFPAEKGRYYLYVSLACPWAHRTLIVRKLKGLEDIIRKPNYALRASPRRYVTNSGYCFSWQLWRSYMCVVHLNIQESNNSSY